MPKKLMSTKEAVKMINPGDTISISSIAGGLTPEKVIGALGKRYSETGTPGNLTIVFPVAVGDGYEIKGLEHLAQEGMIKRLIGGSFTVAKSTEAPPKIYEMMLNNKVEAYNFPMGVIMQLHREVAAKRPGVITEVGLGTFIDPRQEGGRMNAMTPQDLVELIQLREKEYLFFHAYPINVALIRGTTADEKGNITMEHDYSLSTMLQLAMAAHNSGGKVIAQVKRVAKKDTLNPQHVKVPGAYVDAIVIDEHQKVTTGIDYDPASSGELKVAWNTLKFEPLNSMRRYMLRRVLLDLKGGNVVNLGYGITAFVPQVALEEGVLDQLIFTTEHGCYGGLPYTGLQFGGALNAEALIESTSQFDFIDGGGPDVVCLSFAEMDQNGHVNVTKIKELPHVTSGVGGFIDLVQHARKIVFCGTVTAGGLKVEVSDGHVNIAQEGRFRKVVDRVQQITFNGQIARKKGQTVVYVTERCIFNLEPDGVVLREIAPGLDLQKDILDQIGFKVNVAQDLKEMAPSLFRSEVMGLSQLKEWKV